MSSIHHHVFLCICAMFLWSVSALSQAAKQEISLSKAISDNGNVPFVGHRGEGKFDSALAMNVYYAPVQSVRAQLEKWLGRKLSFYTAWRPEGEAHITTISPLEFYDVLRYRVSIAEIEEIAIQHNIQASDLEVLGLGTGSRMIDGKQEQTWFLIVRSRNLLHIREAVYRQFIAKGGDAQAWDPQKFYPHITIGYTRRDLHESDGIIKDVAHALDQRFELVLTE